MNQLQHPEALFSCTVLGQPIVKKNTQRSVVRKRRDGRSFPTIYYTAAYKKWHRGAIQDVLDAPRPAAPIDEPVILLCTFFIQQHNTVDISALYEGIQDVLVECEVLTDDLYTIVRGHDGSRVYVDSDNPRMTVSVIPESEKTPLPPLPRSKIDKTPIF